MHRAPTSARSAPDADPQQTTNNKPVTLTSVDVFRYELPLKPPTLVGGEPVRRGAVLRLETARGAVGWGEAAPLPGFSEESVETAVRQLRRIRGTLKQQSLPDFASNGHDPWQHVEIEEGLAASVRFALESAILSVAASATGLSMPEVLSDDPRPAVSLNALLDGGPDEVEAAAERLRDAGFRAVKMKVGRDDPDYEADAVRILADILGPGIPIRLDANRGWRFDEAVAFAEDVRTVPIQYVEEPLSDPSRLAEFERQSGLPVALDETTREMAAGQLAAHRYARAVVLKPTLLGGLRATVEWARAAAQLGVTPVLSASYESGMGTQVLLALASVLGRRDVPAGLRTYTRFEQDLLTPPLDLHGPTVDVREACAGTREVDIERLTKA
jgi:O-succinylbenzoate synthase